MTTWERKVEEALTSVKNGKSIVITFPEAGKILLRQFIVVGLSDVDPSVNQKKRKMLMLSHREGIFVLILAINQKSLF